jgi:hypothetical protein
MIESKFLKKEDLPGVGALVTVTGIERLNVAKDDGEPEYRWCLSFAELGKPLVLRSTLIQLCEQIFGSDDTDDWINKRIVVFVDPTIAYQGKVIGGIRVRAAKVKPAPAPVVVPKIKHALPPVPAPAQPMPGEDVYDDDVPFMFLLPFLLPALLVVRGVLA